MTICSDLTVSHRSTAPAYPVHRIYVKDTFVENDFYIPRIIGRDDCGTNRDPANMTAYSYIAADRMPDAEHYYVPAHCRKYIIFIYMRRCPHMCEWFNGLTRMNIDAHQRANII